MNELLNVVRAQKAGKPLGIYSLCSAHPTVLEAALREAKEREEPLLIEATSNQVNQFGGYTGMTPKAFVRFVGEVAARTQYPAARLLLGGDHLGPNAWQQLPAAEALKHAADLVDAYVRAGFRKIHLDCSMSLGGDGGPLDDERVAERAAALCEVAERACWEAGGEAPVYVIGTEVPTPGGAHEELTTLRPTTPQAVDVTLQAHREAFVARQLESAWTRVVALVVQPGVEFDHDKVIDYDSMSAQPLSRRIEQESGLVFEAHSTDYQTERALAALVRDHFAVLKVGPGATFALRETLWGLSDLASDWLTESGPSLKQVVLRAMRADPRYWQGYYTDPAREEFDLQFSLSDRIRYYWSVPPVQQATVALLRRLSGRALPLSLLSQYLPRQFASVRSGQLKNEVQAVLFDGVVQALRPYARACNDGAAAGEAR